MAAVSADNINFQMNKTDKAPTDPKIVVPEEYHDFLDVFSKEASDTVAEHSKYDHKIRLLERHKNLGHSPLCVGCRKNNWNSSRSSLRIT